MDKEKFLRNNKFFYWLYKIQKIYKNKRPNTHFGEFGEDIMVSRFFKNKEIGFYIDIGAYHPFKGSLTQKLYKKGWHGVNIDISKTSIDLFKIARPKDININCAIGKVTEETIFFQNSKINQQNSLTAFTKSFSHGFGIEFDVRDSNNEILISHDIPSGNTLKLIDFIKDDKIANNVLAVNIKSDGILEKVQKILNKVNCEWYFFDMSLPETVICHKKNFQ